MLTLYRRHTEKCPGRKKGREYFKCRCPIWCDGILNGKDYRRSLKTRDMQRAIKKQASLESPDGPVFKPISEAVEAFVAHCHDLADGTRRKYGNIMAHLQEFLTTEGADVISDVDVELLDRYRAGRALAGTTALKELQ